MYLLKESGYSYINELSMALRNENDSYCENTNANDMQM